jgi:hypothetical protein
VTADDVIANTQITGELTSQPYQGRILQKFRQEILLLPSKWKSHNSYKWKNSNNFAGSICSQPKDVKTKSDTPGRSELSIHSEDAKGNHFNSYKMYFVQELYGDDNVHQVAFCEWVLSQEILIS